jgi:hypothetical protein
MSDETMCLSRLDELALLFGIVAGGRTESLHVTTARRVWLVVVGFLSSSSLGAQFAVSSSSRPRGMTFTSFRVIPRSPLVASG